MARSNLIVLSHATVSKVNLNLTKGGATATGVQVKFPDGTYYNATLKSTGQVILSAGVVHTPQILELSGIGNSTILRSVGIDAKLNLPGVGENYEDQLVHFSCFRCSEYQLMDAVH